MFNNFNDELHKQIVQQSLQQYKVEDKETFGAVFYTDGGFRAATHLRTSDPTVGGYGVVGYIYANQVPRTGHGCKLANPTQLGFINPADMKSKFVPWKKEDIILPTVVTVLEYIQVKGASNLHTSNNIAEMLAIHTGIKMLLNSMPEVTYAVLKTDSQYVLNGVLDWCHKWKANNWMKADRITPIANQQLWQDIIRDVEALEARGVKLDFFWVKGHSDSLGNAIADVLATESMIGFINGRTEEAWRHYTPRDLWNPTVEFNPLFSEPSLYINNLNPTNRYKEYSIYRQGILGREIEEYTKVNSEKVLSILALKTPDVVVDSLIGLAATLNPDNNLSSFICRLDEILKPKIYTELAAGGLVYIRRGIANRCVLADDRLIMEELIPICHGQRLAASFAYYENLMAAYLDGTLDGVFVTDITDYIYESVEVKKSIKYTVKPDVDISLSVKIRLELGSDKAAHELLLTIGIDTPKLRVLKAMAGEDTRFKVLAWKEPHNAFKYATIIESALGVGLWVGPYSNIFYIT